MTMGYRALFGLVRMCILHFTYYLFDHQMLMSVTPMLTTVTSMVPASTLLVASCVCVHQVSWEME